MMVMVILYNNSLILVIIILLFLLLLLLLLLLIIIIIIIIIITDSEILQGLCSPSTRCRRITLLIVDPFADNLDISSISSVKNRRTAVPRGRPYSILLSLCKSDINIKLYCVNKTKYNTNCTSE